MGSSLFWFENWTSLGALYFATPPNFVCDESIQNIYDVVSDGQWDEEKIREILPEEFATHILHNIKPPRVQDILDKPVWTLETSGEFSVKSAWEYLRSRKDPRNAFKMIWAKGLPFKISFFMWKVWRNKLPLDDFFRRLGYLMASKCWCCTNPMEETRQHVFFTSYAAKTVWSYFLNHAGIGVEGITFHQAVVKCWTAKVIPRLQPIMPALPSIIIWELWKRHNSYKYGESVTINRVIYQIYSTIQAVIKYRKPGLIHVPYKWPEQIDLLENYMPKLNVTKVI
ncbi:uncharacterized protein [Nicotiana tomentosiformis]|uniref:uncharacterized protein n=1 Tax=Nicotiana tomentosiformis TaxID=4098 RepID=UPI00388C84D1